MYAKEALKRTQLTFIRRTGYGLAKAQTYPFSTHVLHKDSKLSKYKRKSPKRMNEDLKRGEKGSNSLVLVHKYEKWLTVVRTCVRILLGK